MKVIRITKLINLSKNEKNIALNYAYIYSYFSHGKVNGII